MLLAILFSLPVFFAMHGVAQAAPSTECPTPVALTVASGGSVNFDESSCSVFGFSGIAVEPSHGSISGVNATTGNATGMGTYVNNGDGATSDTFGIYDDSGGVITFNVTITGGSITLSPSSLPAATVNTAYSQTITASGGTAPYTYTLSAGALPNGMSLSSSGTLSGTPTVAGSYDFTVKTTDSTSATATRTYSTFTVNATVPSAPTIGTATAGNGQATVTFTAPSSNGGATITGYTATSSPGGLTGTCSSSPCTVTGLTNGTAYTFSVTATNSQGTGSASAMSNSVTPQASQTITFSNPGSQNFGTSPTLTATATSGLTVTFTSATTAVCTITSGGTLTTITAGTCTVDANQAGNGTYSAASQVAQSFSIVAVVPGAPTIGVATAGDTQASVSFTAPASNGGAAITSYTATSSPGGFTGSCASSPCTVTGLTNGTSYTFTVTAMNTAGTGTASAQSNSVMPAASQTITFSNPGSQSFGTSPTLTATATSGLTVTFTSATTAVCTITSGGTLTTITTGTCTIDANQAGNGTYSAAPQVAQSFSIVAVVPGAPTIGVATAGNTQASVSFTAPASNGGATITSYTATSNPGGLIGSCASSPCTVTGLTNGTSYTFTVTATNTAGTSTASASSNSVTPAASQTITFNNPGAQNFGTSPTLTATATSGLSVTFTSATSVCTITSGGTLTTITAGTCTIDANQAGNAAYLAASQVAQSFSIAAVVAGAPTIGVATAGNTQASVTFTAPSSDGGATITSYTATSSPGGLTGTCSSSPCTVTGLTNGTSYTFTVTATNTAGTSTASAASNSVTPEASQTITFNNPGTKNFGTSPTLTATATSGLTVTFSSATPAVCTITSGGTLTTVAAGTCTIDANQAGNAAYTAASQVAQSFAIAAVPPGAPTIGSAFAGNAQASVAFTAPASDGGATITSYTATSSPGGLTGTCGTSPCTVTGLTNGTSYTFTVSAVNSAGTGTASSASNSVTPLGSGAITNFAASPASPIYAPNGTFTVSATGDGSTSPVVFAIASGSVGICSISGSTVTMLSSGLCAITANQAGDGSHAAAPQVTLDVTIAEPAVPVVSNASATTAYATATNINLAGDITGTSISAIAIASAPSHGTATVSGETVTYTPAATFYGGTDSFTYTATNPGGTSTAATVTVSVGVPGAPSVAAVHASTAYDTATSIDLTGSITGTDVTAVTIASAPSHGTATVSGKTVTYTPASTFYGGTDTFSYTATNPGGTSAPAVVTVTVTPLAVPSAGALTVTTTTGTSVLINATVGATGAPFTGVSVVGNPTHGSAVASGVQITYTPAKGFVGSDTFTYDVSNNFGSSTPATVTVKVTAAGSAPAGSGTVTVTNTPGNVTNVNLAALTLDGVSAAAVGNYVSSSIVGVSPGNAGTVTLTQPAELNFTSNSTFRGVAQITVLLTTGSGTTVTADVLVLVSSQPDPSKNPDVLGLIDAQTSQAQAFAHDQIETIEQRLERARNGASPAFSDGLSVSLNGMTLPALGDVKSAAPKPGGLGLWVGGAATFGAAQAYDGSPSFDHHGMNLNVGVDKRLKDALFGFALGYDHDDTSVGNDGTFSGAHSVSASIYGGYRHGAHAYVDGVLGGAALTFDSNRFDADAGDYLTGHRGGEQLFGSLTAGYDYTLHGLLFSPYGRFELSNSDLDTYAESGDPAWALNYGSQAVDYDAAVLGVRTSDHVAWGGQTLEPHARLEFGHNFEGAGTTTLSYAAIPTAGIWTVSTNSYIANENTVELEGGADLQLRDHLRLGLDYQYLMQPHANDQTIRFTISRAWTGF
ncbi:MAG TPA: fibronectin type III domain-containing protein [Candidatus Acidoferrales bacterium]|nr:fibronectin type III domain-containing protein [Candidatus Acidoferrales bacterium]